MSDDTKELIGWLLTSGAMALLVLLLAK